MSSTIPIEVLHAGLPAVERYNACLARGESKRMAEMLALRQAPGLSGTDTAFFACGTLDKQIKDPARLQILKENARREGIQLTGNEVYQSALCRDGYPLDPRACIAQSEGRGRIKRMCEESGSGCEGSVVVKARQLEQERKAKYRLNPRIVKQKLRQALKNPENARYTKRELVEQIVDKHGSRTLEIV